LVVVVVFLGVEKARAGKKRENYSRSSTVQ
jgi:hypothetical protein